MPKATVSLSYGANVANNSVASIATVEISNLDEVNAFLKDLHELKATSPKEREAVFKEISEKYSLNISAGAPLNWLSNPDTRSRIGFAFPCQDDEFSYEAKVLGGWEPTEIAFIPAGKDWVSNDYNDYNEVYEPFNAAMLELTQESGNNSEEFKVVVSTPEGAVIIESDLMTESEAREVYKEILESKEPITRESLTKDYQFNTVEG